MTVWVHFALPPAISKRTEQVSDHRLKVHAAEKDIQQLIRCHHRLRKAVKFHRRQGIYLFSPNSSFVWLIPYWFIVVFLVTFHWIVANHSKAPFGWGNLLSCRFSFSKFVDVYRYRVVLFGDAGTGKTALVSQFMTSEYMHTYDASLGKFKEITSIYRQFVSFDVLWVSQTTFAFAPFLLKEGIKLSIFRCEDV